MATYMLASSRELEYKDMLTFDSLDDLFDRFVDSDSVDRSTSDEWDTYHTESLSDCDAIGEKIATPCQPMQLLGSGHTD